MGFVAFSSRRSRVTCVMTPVLRGGACPCGPRPRTLEHRARNTETPRSSQLDRAVRAAQLEVRRQQSESDCSVLNFCVHR